MRLIIVLEVPEYIINFSAERKMKKSSIFWDVQNHHFGSNTLKNNPYDKHIYLACHKGVKITYISEVGSEFSGLVTAMVSISLGSAVSEVKLLTT